MAALNTYRWRYNKPGEAQVIVGKHTLSLDSEGFVETSLLHPDTEARLKRSASFEYVPMNHNALWEGRLKDSQARIEKARAAFVHDERSLARSADLLRTCEEQHRALEQERERYQAAIDGSEAGAPAASSKNRG